jgi:methionine aminopeptidase
MVVPGLQGSEVRKVEGLDTTSGSRHALSGGHDVHHQADDQRGTPDIRFLEDGWTVVTADEKLSAQYEHTIAVTSNGCEILTPWQPLMRKTADLA